MPSGTHVNSRLAKGFFFSSGLTAILILLAAAGAETPVTAPAAFLVDRFNVASLYIPILLVIGGLIIRLGRLPRRTVLQLWLSPLPFVTLGILIQTALGNTELLSSGLLVQTLGRIPGSILLTSLLALEIFVIIRAGRLYPGEHDRLFPPGTIKKYYSDFLSLLGLGIDREIEPGGQGQDKQKQNIKEPLPITPSKFQDSSLSNTETIPTPTENVKPPTNIHSTPPDKTDPAPPEKQEPHPLETITPDQNFPPAPPLLQNKDSITHPNEKSNTDHNPDIHSQPNTKTQLQTPDKQTTPDQPVPSIIDPDILEFARKAQNPGTEDKPKDPDSTHTIPVSNQENPESPPTPPNISQKLAPTEPKPIGIVEPTPAEPSLPKPKKQKSWTIPVQGLLATYPDDDFTSLDEGTRHGASILEQTLREFKIDAKVTGIRKGPVITMYELLPSPGVKISSIVNLQDNIALRLAASRVRMVAPIPGKHAIGIEVPNKDRSIVSFSSLVESKEFSSIKTGIPVILGKDISGNNQVIDMTRTPHLLIAGATGSGKSVCVNSLICSVLYSRSPREVKMIMVDPKIVELKLYNDIPHLLTPVITEPKRALQALKWCLLEMERRYSLLDSQGVRDITSYNRRIAERKLATQNLPYILVIVDEYADLMATSGKELEAIVARLAAMSRAVGIHLVLATQRPSVDVITGLIKANFPSRIAFMVAGKTDSRIIIDAMGADKLLGRGDMLFTSAWDPFPTRMQGAFLAEDEVERLSDHVKALGEPDYIDEEIFIDDDEDDDYNYESENGEDPVFDKALEIVLSTRKASASFLQRRLKLGYNRAARIIEDMEKRGIVGPSNGSKPREILHIPEHIL